MSDMPHEHSLPGRVVLLGLVGLIILALAATLVIRQAGKSHEALPVLGVVPDFTFTERSGEPFGAADMSGHINVVCFFFTRCPGICPVIASRYHELYELYKGSDRVRLISITVDPEHDSLSVLQRYAVDHGVTDNRWVFVLGPDTSTIAHLSEKGFYLPAENLPGGHSGKFALVDSKLQIRGYYNYDDDEAQRLLKLHVRELVRAME